MNLALLGDIAFELLALAGMDGQFGVDYAEHAMIGSKPRLQFVGDKLDEWNIQLRLNVAFCDPAKELSRLRVAASTHTAMDFYLDNGEHKGSYVITSIGVTAEHTLADGTLLVATVSLTLREHVSSNPTAPPPRAKPPGVLRVGQALMNPSAVRRAEPVGSSAMKTIGAGLTACRQAAGAYRSANDVIAAAKAMKSNPTLAIDRALGASSHLVRLAGLEDSVQALSPYTSSADIRAVMHLGSTVSALGRNGQINLNTLNASNITANLPNLASSLENIGGSFDEAAQPLARLTGLVAIRSPQLERL